MADKYKVVGLGKMGPQTMDLESKELAVVDGEVEVVEARCRSEEEMLAATGDADAILGGNPFLTR